MNEPKSGTRLVHSFQLELVNELDALPQAIKTWNPIKSY
jgi:hypothetical protein